MSTNSGITAIKADKNKAKFKIIDINNVYKGTSVGPPKATATARQHGLQSLGKVPSRRMPPPAHLPSLRSEQGGPEQTVSLVPAGGAGWGASGKEEDSGKVLTTPPVTSSPLPSSQPALPVPLPSQVSVQNKASVVVAAEVTAPSSSAQSWSSVTTGAKQQGKLTIVKSRFQEEFPELAAGPDDKSTHQRKEENKELQYGPGPSLRPQNVASWRDGGGRSILQSGSNEDRSSSPVSGSAAKGDGSSSSDDERPNAAPGYQPAQTQHPAAMQRMIHPGMMPGPGPRMPGPPGAGPMMFGPIMPPFMFSGPRFGPQFHGFPPYFHPDQRFRGPLMAPRMAFDEKGQSVPMMKTSTERQAIIKDHALKDFDRLDSDNSWAAAVDRDVDYSAKLVFSDEDDPSSSNQRHDKRLLSPRDRYPRKDRDEQRHEPSETVSYRAGTSDSIAEPDRDHGRPSPRDRKRPPPDRESSHDSISQPSSSQYDRMPVDMHWHARLPFPHPMYPPHMRPPGVGFQPQPRLYGKYESETAEMSKNHDDLPERDWHSRSRELDDEPKVVRSNEESKRNDQPATSTRSMTKLTPQRLVKKTAEENELSNQSPKSETGQSGEPKGARSTDQAPVRAWSSSNNNDDKENSGRGGWQKNQTTTNSQPIVSSLRQSELDEDYKPRNAERISSANEPETIKDSSADHSDFSESARTQLPHSKASDTKDQSSSRGVDKGDNRSQRRDLNRDRSKRSSGAGWADNEKEDVEESGERSQRDDSRSQSRPSVGQDMQWRDMRRSELRPNCPPPISLRYCQNNIATNSRYTPLKRGVVLPAGDSQKSTNDLTSSTSSVQSTVKDEEQTTNQFERTKGERSSHADEVAEASNYPAKTQPSKKKVEDEAAISNISKQSERDLPRQLSWGDAVEEESLRDDEHAVPSTEKGFRRSQAYNHGRSRENTGPSKFKQDNTGDRKNNQETARNDNKSSASNKQSSESGRVDSKSVSGNRQTFDSARNENKSASSNRQISETAPRNERNESKSASGNRQSSDTTRNESKSASNNRQSSETTRNESKSASGNRQSSETARNESKSTTGNRQSFEASRNEIKSTASNKQGFEATRNDNKTQVSSRKDDVKASYDDRPPAKKMKDESSTFYGQSRERPDRNRRGQNKSESYRGTMGRTRYGSGNSSRQGFGKDVVTEHPISSSGTEKRATLTFERSDLRQDLATSDNRKGHVQRPSEQNKKDSAALKSKEDASQQQSTTFDDKPTELHNAPRMNAWNQPLRLPKSESVEPSSKETTEEPAQCVTDKPVEDAGKQDMPSIPLEGNVQLSDRDHVHREYRTGRGRRTPRRTVARKQTGGSLESSSVVDSESHQQRRGQQRGYNSQRGDEASEEFDGASSRGNKRRTRGGPTSGGRGARDSTQENPGYKASAGELEHEHSSRNKISDSGRHDDLGYRQRDNRRRNWRQSGSHSSQAYGRVNSDETRRQPRALTALIAAAPQSPKLQSPTEQNLSDVGNDEWETASESSEVLTHTHHHHHRPQDIPGDDTKKPQSFSGSRRVQALSDSSRGPGSDRATRRSGQATRGSGVAMRRHEHAAQKQSTELSVARAGSSAGDASNKAAKAKVVELKDEAARAAKAEKDKKDAMANIDINNYASVVVIDDQPEVSIEDPSFLFESNEGFQEVTSRKVQKIRQKAAALEEAKKTQELQIQAVALAKKAEKDARKRLAVSASKLPPRLTGRREKKQHSRTQQQQQQQSTQQSAASDHVAAPSNADILPKIENWDNEMANNIPSSLSATMTGTMQPVRAVGTAAPVVISPAMPIGKWERGQCDPVTVVSTTMATPASAAELNSSHGDEVVKSLAALSLHSSSESDNQLRMSSVVDIMSSEDGSMQQRQPVPSSQSVDMRLSDMGSFMTDASSAAVVQSKAVEKTIVKPMPKMDESRTVIKKPDSRTSRTTYEPIELPSNYAFGKFGKGEETSELKLEFTFDADLAKMSGDKPEVEVKDPPPPITMPPGANLHRGTAVVTANVNDLVLPLQSPAADDLNMKIASVKNVWERENHHSSASLVQYFEQSIINAGAQRGVNALSSDDQVVQAVQSQQQQQHSPSTQQNIVSYADYSGYMDVVSSGGHQMSDMGCIDGSVGTILDHNSAAALVYIDGSSYAANNKDNRNLMNEQTNVCKVRPQQLQASSSPPSLVRVGSSLANAAQLMYGQGYQYAVGALAQETANMGLQYGNQAPYGYGMTQQPAQTALLAPVGQNNLFLQPAALQQNDLYRNAFGLSAGTPQSTIMVSSATSTLMSAAIKPPSQHIYLASGSQKSGAAVQYGQLMGQAGGLMYENTANTGQSGLPTSPVGQQTDPLLGVGQQQQASQIIGSHLVQQRTAMQAMQPTANYFSQTPLQQTGFYQAQQAAASGSTLQGSYQQMTAQPFSLSSFGHQTPAVTVAVQPVHSQLKLSAPPFKPVSQQVQMKTSASSQSYTPTQHSTTTGYLQQQLYGNLIQQQQQQQQQPGSQQHQYHQYYTQSHQPSSPATNQPQFYSLPQQQQVHISEQLQMPSSAAGGNTSPVVGANWQRHPTSSASVTGPASSAASTHSQRQTPVTTSYSGSQLQQSTPAPEQSKMVSAASKSTSGSQRTYNSVPSNTSATQVRGGAAGSDTLRELQAQERRKALQQVQSFLNPQNKPPAKSATSSTKNNGKDTSDDDKKQVET